MIVETKRLILRRPEPDDFDRFWSMLSDPIAKEYTGGVTKLSYDQRRNMFLQDCLAEFSSRGTEFAVIQKETLKYLGYCGFRYSEELTGNEFLFGYCRDSWGRGYATEAAEAVLGHLFNRFGHETYVATVHPLNLASKRVLEKLGFTYVSRIAIHEGEIADRYLIRRGDLSWSQARPATAGP